MECLGCPEWEACRAWAECQECLEWVACLEVEVVPVAVDHRSGSDPPRRRRASGICEGGTVWWLFGGPLGVAGPPLFLHSRATIIKLRLKRFGKKREASFRLVACNSTSRRDGRPLQELGFYNPRTKETRLDTEAIRERLGQGAQPTDVVRTLLERGGLLEKTVRPAETVGKAKQAAKREADAKQAAKEAAEAKAAAAEEKGAEAEASDSAESESTEG